MLELFVFRWKLWLKFGWLLEYDLISSGCWCIVSQQIISKQRAIFPRNFSHIFSSGKLRFLFNCLGSIGRCQLSVGSPQYSNTTTQINQSSCFQSCFKDLYTVACVRKESCFRIYDRKIPSLRKLMFDTWHEGKSKWIFWSGVSSLIY